MVVPLRNKHSLKQTGFQLTDDGFLYCGSTYKFDDVEKTWFAKNSFEVRRLGVGVTNSSSSIGFMLLMETGEEIKLHECPTWFSSCPASDIEHVQNIFNTISQKTWNNRVRNYEKQIEGRGFFFYSGWNFYPREKKILNVEKKITFFVDSTNFLRQYGFISMVPKDEGLSTKLLRNSVGKTMGISTHIDTDVFFALLRHYFNIQF